MPLNIFSIWVTDIIMYYLITDTMLWGIFDLA